MEESIFAAKNVEKIVIKSVDAGKDENDGKNETTTVPEQDSAGKYITYI